MPTAPYQSKVKIKQKYHIIGFISSGTYGRVYKARARTPPGGSSTAPSSAPSPSGHGTPPASSNPSTPGGSNTTSSSSGPIKEYAIKKFKPDKEGEVSYTGISQSAIREMALCSELAHENVIHLVEIILEDKCIYMVFEYAEHDLLQIIHFHSHPERRPIPEATVKSVLWQLLNGVSYLHQNWVLHRDLKPANIMVTAAGEVKIGDLGLARLFYKPLQSLFTGDKVVVTIWYRAPELLLGSRHYTPAIDLWAVGCIFAELLALRPIFKGEEAKMDNKKNVPFQRNQMMKIVEILGMPTKERWQAVSTLPEYGQLQQMAMTAGGGGGSGGKNSGMNIPPHSQLEGWFHSIGASNPLGFDLLRGLLEYDPVKRLTAQQALEHKYFTEGTKLTLNAFEGQQLEYPHRRVSQDDNDISLPGTKRTGLADDSLGGQRKRMKEG
ncbi:kinase-like domain-containing protein [Peziza echinospora]|nr:kinase-like domain-containing protein [Peziza echinospora]